MNKVSFNSKNKYIILITAIIFIIIAVIIVVLHSIQIKKKENEIFTLNKLVIYNSMGIINNDNNPSLINLNINQFSDLSLFISNNLKDDNNLNKYNTIKELYIDNISIVADSKGSKILNYKNSLSLGKYENLHEPENGKIVFNIQKSNFNTKNSDYSSPTFYTDCSNPITLGYINKDVINNYSISSNSNIVSYNAKVLKNTNINLHDLNATLIFTIHIINNAAHKLSCNVKLNISLDEDFVNNGYSYITIPLSGDEYKFKR